jgi:hypothetical protein
MLNKADLSSRLNAIDHLLGLERETREIAAKFKVNFKLSPVSIREHLLTCEEEDVNPWDDKEFFLLSMRSLGLQYPGDFLSKLESDFIIEGYDLERRQIFRNMRFMELSSYSLTEMLSNEWTSLFERPAEVTDMMLQYERDLFKDNRTLELSIPKHLIRELRSSQPQLCEVEHKYFAPLYSGPNRPGGGLSVCRGRVVDANLDVYRENVTFI